MPFVPPMSLWFDRLLAQLPTQCLVCRAWGGEPLCPSCASLAPAPAQRCGCCALPLEAAVAAHSQHCGACVAKPPPLAACAAAVSYAAPWNDCISLYKFHGQVGLGRHLARRMWREPRIARALAQCDAVVPMPLSRQRLQERGYNQALQLAKPLAAWAGRRLDTYSLLRLHERPPQRSLRRGERLTNVQGVFAVVPQRVAQIEGRHLVLVDDVMTSGASLHAAALALLQAGARSVGAVVFARTAEPN